MAVEPIAKPLWRGVSHHMSFFVAIGAGAVLLALAPSARAFWAGFIYVVSLLALFGVSALYHRIQWSEVARLRMKRLDHATIFVFIAGSYTPICLLALEPGLGWQMLGWVWLGAGLGVARAVFWPGAPKAVSASLYVALGWLVVAYTPSLWQAVGNFGMGALAAGGVLYSVGAAVYAFQRPDPLPRVFGYHEVFHALVVAACVCHFAAIARVVFTA